MARGGKISKIHVLHFQFVGLKFIVFCSSSILQDVLLLGPLFAKASINADFPPLQYQVLYAWSNAFDWWT